MDGAFSTPSTGVRRGSDYVPHTAQPQGRKKGTACVRCRKLKVRCDDSRPSCGNCLRANQPCVRANLGSNAETLSYITQLETRLHSLEGALQKLAPEELERAPTVTGQPPARDIETSYLGQAPGITEDLASSSAQNAQAGFLADQFKSTASNLTPISTSPATGLAASSPSASSTQIGPSEPLAHEVGLLSLTNSAESKYLGPSSGISFARLIFSAVPQTQGLASNWDSLEGSHYRRPAPSQPFPHDWIPDVDLQPFFDAYFETYQPLYPFLDEDSITGSLEVLFYKSSPHVPSSQMPPLSEVEASVSPFQSVQIFLIAALGAKILETRLSSDFSSERLLATAVVRTENLALHDSIEGLQIMLLLTLSSFCFENGPNAWFLTSTIIASCLDMGFQRRWIEHPHASSLQDEAKASNRRNLRSGIFWSVYSLERTLSVVLGRPLTLRDEAIDVEFPGGENPIEQPELLRPEAESYGDRNTGGRQESTNKRARFDISPYSASRYSFRFDQITAEIKLMLYRVVNLPRRFPWPANTAEWQQETHKRCDVLLRDLLRNLKWRSRRSISDVTVRSLELKYHHCLMLLHRPSPATPQPSIESWKFCYESAVKTISINNELHRFAKLNNSWMTAHTVFVSGITFLYCLWLKPEIKEETGFEAFSATADACTGLLKFLCKTWTVAEDAMGKFQKLAQLTKGSWNLRLGQREDASGNDSARDPIVYPDSLHDNSSSSIANEAIEGPRYGGAFSAGENGEDGSVFEPEFFFTELGDMSTWFDLDWMSAINYNTDMVDFSTQ